MTTNNHRKAGILLMTYGSATTSANVEAFLEHVYLSGPDPELVAVFKRRFDIVHRSPLIEITVNQGKALQQLLDKQSDGHNYVVRAGMLHSAPFIGDAIAELRKAGADHIIGIILSPQFSDFIMGGYKRSLVKAAEQHGYRDEDICVVGPWPDEPHFIRLISQNLLEKYALLTKQYVTDIPIIFTTHSLPQRVVDKDPGYLQQLKKTMLAVVKSAKLTDGSWTYAYQSAGHSPEPWLKPDLVDVLADLRPQNVPAVLIVPLQFLADHLEILYDLDTAAAEQCSDYGMSYNRIELPNTNQLFIETLANLATSHTGFIEAN